jgi:2-desacetyl-2-hydroxyethyl bacteriochlorophyllide A dehydrogenase
LPRVLTLEGPRQLCLTEHPAEPPAPGQVLLRSIISGISHGTELNLYRGTSFSDRVFDRDLRAFVPAAADRPPYPATLGYELISVVEQVGEGVTALRPGDLVHTGTHHREQTTLDVETARRVTYPLVKLPDDAPLERALFLSVGAVALQAVHDAAIKLGDHVAVVGLGAIGLLTLQMARLAGAASVHVADPVAERRELASALGADSVVDPGGADGGTGVAIKRALGGQGVDVAIDTSGTDAGLHDALASARLAGTVVAVGFYQGGAPRLRLGEEWHHNRLTLLSSMGAWGAPHRSAPCWDRERLMSAVVELLRSGAVSTERLLTRTYPFAEAAAAYEWLADHPAEAIKVALSYN